jgi:cytidine deaminase
VRWPNRRDGMRQGPAQFWTTRQEKNKEAPEPITDEQIRALRDAAIQGRAKGWRPYSRFAVGAAVLTVGGKIYGGAGNVECANYTLTKHAEETAILAAMADGAMACNGRQFIWAIYVATVNGKKAMPCGSCRQFIWEFSAEDTVVINELPSGVVESTRLARLLPDPFGPDDLGIREEDNPL